MFSLLTKDGQRRLTEVADETVIRVSAGQERLQRQQQQLHSNYEDVQRSISFTLKGNMRALHQEKMLIDSGRTQLKEMAKTVKEKLGWYESIYTQWNVDLSLKLLYNEVLARSRKPKTTKPFSYTLTEKIATKTLRDLETSQYELRCKVSGGKPLNTAKTKS